MKSTVGQPRRLTDAQVAEILAWHATRKTLTQVAEEYGVCTATISNVIERRGQYKQPSPELRPVAVRRRRTRLKELHADGWL
jgi:IS30 family transposase